MTLEPQSVLSLSGGVERADGLVFRSSGTGDHVDMFARPLSLTAPLILHTKGAARAPYTLIDNALQWAKSLVTLNKQVSRWTKGFQFASYC